MSKSAKVIVVGMLIVFLAACGNTPGQRALSGGAIGAGVGAAGAAITGGNVGTGALIGGGIGAVGGAVTKKKDINLGDFPR